jgi:hypothetical protein
MEQAKLLQTNKDAQTCIIEPAHSCLLGRDKQAKSPRYLPRLLDDYDFVYYETFRDFGCHFFFLLLNGTL